MTDRELLYHFPYRIDKEENLRKWINDSNGYYDLVLGKHDTKYENGQLTHFRHDSHFSEKEKSDNYLKFSNFISWKKWYDGGRNIFSFSKEILEMLNYTDVDNVSINSIKLPYSNFYLSIKPLGLYLDEDTKELIEGVFVNDNQHFTDGRKRLEFQFAGSFEKTYEKHSKQGLPKVYKGNFWDFDLFFNEKININTIQDSLDDEIEMLELEIFPEEEKNSDTKVVTDNKLDFYKRKVDFTNNIVKLIINCLLYLSLPKENQDISERYPDNLPHNFNRKMNFAKGKKEIEKIHKRIKETGFSSIKYIGDNYRKNHSTNSEIGVLISSHWRRGHWRHQAFGKEFKQKKLVWIHPTIVNSQNGNPEKGHVYKINE